MTNFNNIAYITSFFSGILIAILVLKQGKKQSNILFSMTVLSSSLWILVNFLVSNIGNINILWLTIQTAIIGPLFIGPLFLMFAMSFPEEKKIELKLFIKLVAPMIFFVPFIFTKYNVSEVTPSMHPGESVDFTPGVLYLFLGLYLVIYISASLFVLFKKYKQAEATTRKQLKLILLGFLSSFSIALIASLVLPLLNYSELGVIGPISTILFETFTAYAIYKYKFLDVRVILGKVLFITVSSIPPYIIYFVLAFIYESKFGTSFNTYAYIIGIPVSLIFTLFTNNFVKYISEYTDSHLINPGYNPLVVLEQLRQRLTTSLDIEKISQESLFMISRTIRPDSSGVIIMTNNQTNELLSFNYKKEPYSSTQDFNMFLQFFITRNIRTITANDLKDPQQYTSFDPMLKSHILSQMEKYELEVILPLKEEQKVRGILLVGFKEAKAPYNSQELKLLISIAETMSLGIGRALLYKEIQQFNETLQKKVTDATAQLQQKNKALEEALLKLEEVRRQEKDMLDVMGHELRTPISIARNSVVTLQKHISRNDTDPEKLSKYTKMAVESIRREIALIETFLSTTKLEGGRMQVNPEKVSLKDVIHESLEGHNDLSKRNNTQVIFNEPENDIFVIADKIRIQEVMDNFLNNAIKYTGEGNVEITMYEQEGLGWIDVKDDGIGISPENLQKLGRKFFRAQTLYNQSNNVVNPSGTGLGLFVSFQLIDLMHGKRKVTSQEGQGSTFSFGLPLFSE